MILERIKINVQRNLGLKIKHVEQIAQSGSARQYFRLLFEDGSSFVLCISGNIKENQTFVKLTEIFRKAGNPVPQIYWIADDWTSYLQQDLGKECLLDYIRRDEGKELDILLEHTIKRLVIIQNTPECNWKEAVEFQPFSDDLIWYDFNYCISNFFDIGVTRYDKGLLKKELEILCCKLLSYPPDLWGFMYRDFQSRNIMIVKADGNLTPYFIDYQSGRKGPGIYDLVSFLWQAKANFKNETREKVLKIYAHEIQKYVSLDVETMIQDVPYWALFRMLQTLGAYGLRGLKEGKAHFLESIPLALKNIKELLTGETLSGIFPCLTKIIEFKCLQ